MTKSQTVGVSVMVEVGKWGGEGVVIGVVTAGGIKSLENYVNEFTLHLYL